MPMYKKSNTSKASTHCVAGAEDLWDRTNAAFAAAKAEFKD